MDRETLTRHLVPAVGPEIEETMLTYGQQLEQQGFARGREQGLEQGREEGLEQGQRAFLLRLLERRFGPLPQPITERVSKASIDDIATWGERIFSAASLDDVFAS